jgi:hypothetical protein
MLVAGPTSDDDVTGLGNGRFTRAIQQRNLWAAESSLRELGQVSLEDALGYLGLLAEMKPEKVERAVVRWHGRSRLRRRSFRWRSRSSRSPRIARPVALSRAAR